MYDGRAIANLILDQAASQGISVTNLTLQKIIYFCHVWHIVRTGEPLLKHRFEAWEYGPVLPYLYRDFKRFGEGVISERAVKLDRRTGEKEPAKCEIDEETETLLTQIIAFYSRLSASQLVEFSHVSGGPWDRAWNHHDSVNPGMQISDRDILEFYSSVKWPFVVQ